ncbi:hypothetical protein M670_01749 [Schinkia azotoformans MEV2011]|uniref:Uncharacterized protein n=2 Tax=Schinkia azotoformans TaxID=1454 RepID=K6CQ13_SCHAZ|nr:hypothetical protein [Schinkia azotoformans]EKN62347.1 hypothetical protein BAZO_21308 [Schinkia azotoformans LMG 9581]KEF38933.1 hypothetical protein M670_01749 [Schinkia azotoformans MEV2011]MEC1638026.1 hypothetical protein [Schinkia azotoformans]MEC1694503.1 hypothetical protein [Schinkia azotoformans]MEC1714542.1 hypothetical protein [Schinkia azotoformans]
MKFPKNVILESVVERKNHPTYGLEFVQELGNDDAGYDEMVVVIFKYQDKYYSVEIQHLHGDNNYDHWGDEVDCPEVIRKEAVTYYWEEVKKELVMA